MGIFVNTLCFKMFSIWITVNCCQQIRWVFTHFYNQVFHSTNTGSNHVIPLTNLFYQRLNVVLRWMVSVNNWLSI